MCVPQVPNEVEGGQKPTAGKLRLRDKFMAWKFKVAHNGLVKSYNAEIADNDELRKERDELQAKYDELEKNYNFMMGFKSTEEDLPARSYRLRRLRRSSGSAAS